MDALLIGLLGCLLGEMGDKGQLLVLALSKRFERKGAVIVGIACAAVVTAALAAVAGHFLAPMLGSSARLLFLALALLFLAGGMVWPVKAPDSLAGWRIESFLTTALGLIILSFGDGAQFLILGVAARTADPLLAATGGAIGLMAAWVPVVVLRDGYFRALPVRAIRLGGALLIFLGALAAAVAALGLA
jgi:putative Ca2+/H+ antiporter (TMEM165/GDT1 family)